MQTPHHKKGDPWFEDGNFVLVTGPQLEGKDASIAFKVHRGVLIRHSDVFRSMFEDAHPPQDDELFDGCLTVTMPDLPSELSVLIKALYDGPCFPVGNRSIQDFYYATAVLRLSTKYCIAHLRTEAIKYLTEVWAYTLSGHDRMVELAVNADPVDGLTYPFVHPLHVLHLAQLTDTRLIIPAAIYFLTNYPLVDLLNSDHPKLQVENPSQLSSELTAQDLQQYTLAYQYRIDTLIDFIRQSCLARPSGKCRSGALCQKAFTTMGAQLSRDWRSRTGPLHFIVQAVDGMVDYPNICSECRKAFRQDAMATREMFWENLPTVIGLPPWEELLEDLNPNSLRLSAATPPPESPSPTPSPDGSLPSSPPGSPLR